MSEELEQTPSANSEAHSLRTAREQLKLTQQEVAQRLRLPLRVITSIDNQRYEDLAAPAYVRGYLRAYANLVGIEAATVIRHYDNNFAPDNPEVQPYKSHPAQQFRSNEIWVKAVSWLVITVLLLLLGAWLKNRYFDATPELTLPFEESVDGLLNEPAESDIPPGTTDSDSLVPMTENAQGVSEFIPPEEEDIYIPEVPELPLSDESDSTAAEPATQPDELPQGSDLNTEAETEADAGETDLPADSIEGETSAPATDPGLAADTESAADDSASADSEDAAETIEPMPAGATDLLTLRLVTTDQAWIEITDADGNRVYYNLAKAGTDTEVSGSPPLKFLVGNSPEVSLEVNGEPFDLNAYMLEGVARFILNADGSASENR